MRIEVLPESRSSNSRPTNSARQPLASLGRREGSAYPPAGAASRQAIQSRMSLGPPTRFGAMWAWRQTLPKAAKRNCPSTESCGVASRGARGGHSSTGRAKARWMQAAMSSILPQQVAALHAAHGADPLHVGRLPLGQLDDQVVAEHAPRGLIATLRLAFAPLPQLVDDRQAPLVEARVARDPPPALARRGAAKLFAPGCGLFLSSRTAGPTLPSGRKRDRESAPDSKRLARHSRFAASRAAASASRCGFRASADDSPRSLATSVP